MFLFICTKLARLLLWARRAPDSLWAMGLAMGLVAGGLRLCMIGSASRLLAVFGVENICQNIYTYICQNVRIYALK